MAVKRNAQRTTQTLNEDPEIQRAVEEQAEKLESEVEKIDAEAEAEKTFASLDAGVVTGHPIGNGHTIPLPYPGEDTTEASTCSSPNADNRGCNMWGRCPGGKRWAKMHRSKGGAGSFAIVYKNLRSGKVSWSDCFHFIRNNVSDPKILILPGVNWTPSLMPEFKNLPDGRQPMPGPGATKTPVVFTPTKNFIECVIPKALAEDYQKLRRRGEV